MATSYDIFDTLLFRRQVSPESIFEQMAEKIGIKNFVKLRKEAQGNSGPVKHLIASYDYIYNFLAARLGWSQETMEQMQDMEIELETENLFPIVETISKIKDGDILVTDMYLPARIIMKILKKKGLKTNVRIFQTYSGKHSGEIWHILDTFGIKVNTHIGDNAISDIAKPRSFGIKTIETRLSDFTSFEKAMFDSGMKNMSYMLRFIRLLNPRFTLDTYLENLYFILPRLILFSIEIHKRSRRRPILFVTRDCVYLYEIYKALYPEDNSHIFYSSRHMSNNVRTEAYLNYVRTFGDDILVIDIQATGTSLNKFLLSIPNPPNCELYVLLREPWRPNLDREGYTSSGFTSQFKAAKALEMMIQVPFGTTVDYTEEGPMFGKPEFNTEAFDFRIFIYAKAAAYIKKFPGDFSGNIALLDSLTDQNIGKNDPIADVWMNDPQDAIKEYKQNGRSYKEHVENFYKKFETFSQID